MNRLIPAALLAVLAGAAAAGPMQHRLTLEADLVREASFSGVDRGRAKLVQNVKLQVLLSSDGTPLMNNPLDPEDGRRHAERAQRTQQKVQAALQKAPAAAAPDPQAAMARAQALMARCGQDRDCLMREASAMSAAQVGGGNAALRGRMEAYGAAVRGCEKQHAAAAAREACIADARRRAGGSDDSDEDDAVETPYRLFTGAVACRFDAKTTIDERVEGSFDDVQGVVPFTATAKADGRETDAAVCPLLQAVLDTRNGRLWTRVLPVLRGVPGVSVRAEKGRKPQQDEAVMAPRWHEGEDWLAARLANLNATGSDRLERTLPGGRLDLRLRWTFAPL